MNFIKIEDISKLWRKPNKKLTKKDIQELNKKAENVLMQKYKNKAEQRLKIENINPNDLLNSKWEKIDYNEITADYFIEKWYRLLFMYREKNLSWQQRLRINQIFKEFDYWGFLQEAWTLKEDFMDAMDDLDMDEIDRIMEDCFKSQYYRIKQFWKTIIWFFC